MCRILYALNQPNVDSKIRRFMTHSRSLRNVMPALDGYGLAGFNHETGKWQIYRSVSDPGRDPNSKSVAEKMAVHPLVIGHLRNFTNSNPSKPALENTHPFYYKNRVFLHNGQINEINTPQNNKWVLANILPEFHRHIRGQTDTELLFYLFLTILSRTEQHMLRGCILTNRMDVLRESIKELFRMLDTKFQKYIANFVYAEKEYSIVTHIMKNATENDLHQNPMYINHPANNKGLLFSSEPVSKNYEPVKMNAFYIVNHQTGEYQMHNLSSVLR